jgi:hypothetical protein
MKKIFILAAFSFGLGCQKPEARIVTETVIIYRDTCDSQFKAKIGQIESNNKDFTIGDGGRAYGRYQIHQICLKGSGLMDLLRYTHHDMFDSTKAEQVFWATMGIHSHTFAQRHGRYPTYEELARMWNGGPNGYKKQSTLNYLKKFRKL